MLHNLTLVKIMCAWTTLKKKTLQGKSEKHFHLQRHYHVSKHNMAIPMTISPKTVFDCHVSKMLQRCLKMVQQNVLCGQHERHWVNAEIVRSCDVVVPPDLAAGLDLPLITNRDTRCEPSISRIPELYHISLSHNRWSGEQFYDS